MWHLGQLLLPLCLGFLIRGTGMIRTAPQQDHCDLNSVSWGRRLAGRKCSGNVNSSRLVVLNWRGLTRKPLPTKSLGLYYYYFLIVKNSIEIDEELKWNEWGMAWSKRNNNQHIFKTVDWKWRKISSSSRETSIREEHAMCRACVIAIASLTLGLLSVFYKETEALGSRQQDETLKPDISKTLLLH